MVFGAIVMVLFKKHLLQFPIIYYQYTAFGWIFCMVTLYPMILLCLFISTISCFVDFGGIFCADNLICEWCCFSLSNLWAFYLFIFGLIVLPEASITMLKEMVRVDILVLGPFLCFTSECLSASSLLLILIISCLLAWWWGLEVFTFSILSDPCPSLSNKGSQTIWTHSFFYLSPNGYGVLAFFFYSLSPALDPPLCHEHCSSFPKHLNLRLLFCSGERVEASRAGLCSFPEVATTHLPQASTMKETFSGLLFCTQSLLSNEI